VATPSRGRIVWDRSNTGIVGSKPPRNMHISSPFSLLTYPVQVELYDGPIHRPRSFSKMLKKSLQFQKMIRIRNRPKSVISEMYKQVMFADLLNVYFIHTPWCRTLYEKLIDIQLDKKFPAFFTEPDSSSPCPRKPTIGPYPDLTESN